MKLNCEICLINRRYPGQNQSRFQKATLALGSTPQTDGKPPQPAIILFTTQNKSGTKYKLKDNLTKVFAKFADKGKATFSFKAPDHDIQIKSDPIQLKSFLTILRATVEGKDPPKLGSLTAVTRHEPVKTKLSIRARSEFPKNGFPRTLKQLEIIGIQLCRVSPAIFLLKNLTCLNLSDNSIESIPPELGSLRIAVLNLRGNKLDASEWRWLLGAELKGSLGSLDLSENGLKKFPINLIQLERLIDLNLGKNNLKRLPAAIRRMMSLRILNLSDNHLETIPLNINRIHFEHLDLSGNRFLPPPTNASRQIVVPVPSLLELTARLHSSVRNRYQAAILPSILVDVLEQAPLCQCGNLVFSGKTQKRKSPMTRMDFNCDSLTVDGKPAKIYPEVVYCSSKCSSMK